jgi:HSP20 family protein
MSNMVTYPQWTSQGLTSTQAQDPVRQLFDRQLFNRLFDGGLFGSRADESSVVTSQWAPPVDIVEERDRFVLYADIPGVDPQDIEVQMDRGLLTIKGVRRGNTQMDDGRYSRVERMHGSFHRRFALPDSADPEGISASGHNGVLQVVIPKRPESQPRRIQVGNTLDS